MIVVSDTSPITNLMAIDKIGRSIAQRRGIPVIGLLGVLLLAKKRGLIQSVGGTVDSLMREAGFHVSADVRLRVLDLAGESDGRSDQG